MRRMPNLNISEAEYKALCGREETRGSEAIICSSTAPNTLYKLFIDENDSPCPMSDNKQRKVVEIYQRDLEHSVRPLSTISCNGEIVGYEITRDLDDRSFQQLWNLTRKTVIEILKQTRIILEYYARQDITYGDVNDRNILINIKTGEVKFCDIDNIRLGQYPIDLKGPSLTRYYESTDRIDTSTDAYMHNLLTMNKLYFNSASDKDIITALDRGIYPTKFQRKANPIFESMTTPERFQGEYVIQYVKR